MIEITDNALVINNQIFNELVQNRDAARTSMTIPRLSEKNWLVYNDQYNKFNDQIKLMSRICLNLGIEIK